MPAAAPAAPRQVLAASVLAMVNAALGLAAVGVTVLTQGGTTAAGVVGLVIALALVALTAVVAVQLRRGRGWARSLLVVLAALDLLSALVLLLPHVASAGDALALAQFATSSVAAVLTFVPVSDAWFRALRPDGPGA